MGGTSSHETYRSINADIYDGHKYWAKFENDYFAEGACRWAFKGTLHGDGRRDGSLCVTKVVKNEFAKYINMAPDLAASKKAFGFAKQFSERYFPKLRNYISDYEIEFLIPLIAKVQDVSSFKLLWFLPVEWDERYVKQYEHVAIEPFISGSYTKFNSNGGYEKSMHELMTAFCHWTWSTSGHNFMVCDLQGVKSGKKYKLTDPAIHSSERLYGDTDLGVAGMNMVLANHECNRLCRELGLANPVPPHSTPGGQRSTTYSFQVTEEELLRQNRRKRSDYFKLSEISE